MEELWSFLFAEVKKATAKALQQQQHPVMRGIGHLLEEQAQQGEVPTYQSDTAKDVEFTVIKETPRD